MRYCGQLSFKWAEIATSRVSVDGQRPDFSTCMKGEHQLFLFELVRRAPPLSVTVTVPLFVCPVPMHCSSCVCVPLFPRQSRSYSWTRSLRPFSSNPYIQARSEAILILREPRGRSEYEDT